MGRYFEPKDFEKIELWRDLRGMPSVERASYPKTGWLVEKVGVGFLYRTDSNIGILESYLTNPRTSPEERAQALDEITQKLIEAAGYLGVKYIKCDTQIKKVMDLASRHGFRKIGRFEVFMKGT